MITMEIVSYIKLFLQKHANHQVPQFQVIFIYYYNFLFYLKLLTF